MYGVSLTLHLYILMLIVMKVYESVEQSVRSVLKEQHALEVEQLTKAHETQLTYVYNIHVYTYCYCYDYV